MLSKAQLRCRRPSYSL